MKKYVLIQNDNVIYHYYSDNKPTLNKNKGIVYEVQLVSKPNVLDSEKAVEYWTIEDDKYVQSWEIENVTIQDTWHDDRYIKRIKIALSNINTITILQEFVSKLILWWLIKGMHHYSDNEYAYFYCNFIYEEHQSIINQFENYIIIEDLE